MVSVSSDAAMRSRVVRFAEAMQAIEAIASVEDIWSNGVADGDHPMLHGTQLSLRQPQGQFTTVALSEAETLALSEAETVALS